MVDNADKAISRVSIQTGAKSSKLVIAAHDVLEDTVIGDSISTNGVCLTVSKLYADGFEADVMAETMRRSSLGELHSGDRVNLERAMQLNGRFGGHIVSGHIDGTGEIVERFREENAVWLRIQTSAHVLRYIVEKGSIAIDGISLTVSSVGDADFRVSIIPHTALETTLLSRRIGQRVNLECDIVGKYVERLMQPASRTEDEKKPIDIEFLAKHGFL